MFSHKEVSEFFNRNFTETRLRAIRIFLSVFVSAYCFSMATVFVKNLGVIPTTTIVFGRFFLGTLIMSVWFWARKSMPQFRDWRLLLGRAVTNIVAVWFFYECVRLTNVTKANVYNMTYPIFVAAFSPLLLKEKTNLLRWVAVFISVLGVVLIIDPVWGTPGWGDVVGLLSGVTAASTVMVLRKARGKESVDAIVFVLMATGTVVLAPKAELSQLALIARQFPLMFGELLAASLLGVFGQILFTYGYKYLSAVDGSVVNSVRIIFAAFLGWYYQDDPITLLVVIGSILIVFGIYLVGKASRKVLAEEA